MKAAAPVPVHQRLTEQQLQGLVFSMCGALRLYVYHTHDARGSVPGFPDLVIIGKRVLWRELKSWRQSSQPTREQFDVLTGLLRAGQDVEIWRPADWFSGRIKAQLVAVRHRSTPPKRGDYRARPEPARRSTSVVPATGRRRGAESPT